MTKPKKEALIFFIYKLDTDQLTEQQTDLWSLPMWYVDGQNHTDAVTLSPVAPFTNVVNFNFSIDK